MMKMFSFRAPEEIMKEAEKLAELERVDKSTLIREALEKGFEKIRVDTAIKLFAQGKLSIGESAEIAGLSVGELMEVFRERGISSRITKEEMEEAFANAIGIIR